MAFIFHSSKLYKLHVLDLILPQIGQPSPLKRFYVKGNKLYTGDNKQIKCFHFVEGLGGRSDEEFDAIMKDFKYKWFNVDTIKFFKEQCGCSEFFN